MFHVIPQFHIYLWDTVNLWCLFQSTLSMAHGTCGCVPHTPLSVHGTYWVLHSPTPPTCSLLPLQAHVFLSHCSCRTKSSETKKWERNHPSFAPDLPKGSGSVGLTFLFLCHFLLSAFLVTMKHVSPGIK